MAYRGTITAAGLPAYNLHVYDEGILVAKPRVVSFVLIVLAISAALFTIAVTAGASAGVLLIVAGLAIPSLWRKFIKRPVPDTFPGSGPSKAAGCLNLEDISSANFEEGTGGKRSLTLRTRQGDTRRFTWWTESNIARNPDVQVRSVLTPILAKPRSFIA